MTNPTRLYSTLFVVIIGGLLLMLPVTAHILTSTTKAPVEPLALVKGWAQSADNESPYLFAADATGYDYGDPSVAEQVHLEEINLARKDPQAEAARHGIELQEGVETGKISGNPSQPLTHNAKLAEAAIKHSMHMINDNFFAHQTPQGVTPVNRIDAEGYIWQTVGENLAWRGSTAPLAEIPTVIQQHADLFIDLDVPGRGHRVNILEDSFREVGVGVAFGAFVSPFDGINYTNSYLLTTNFGTARDDQAFILGVVFDDQNADGAYSAGEGLAGVVIRVVGAGLQTTTATAGGYGIPVGAGNFTIEAKLTDGRVASQNVTLADKNKKIDFMLGDFVGAANTDPQPSITANGTTGTLNVTSQQAVAIAIGMAKGSQEFANGDYWILRAVNGDVQYLNVATLVFVSGFQPTVQAPLLAFNPLVVSNQTLPAGSHIYCFAFDGVANGSLDTDQVFFSCVNVIVSGA
jgi:uncharacterized protein YkwD